MKIAIINGTIVNSDEKFKANILLENGKIAKIGGEKFEADKVIDATNKLVMPGLIDMHVHFRDPGQEYKDDIISGSQAAVAGGVTTCLCMANTNPVNDNASITRAMIEKAKNCGLIDLVIEALSFTGFVLAMQRHVVTPPATAACEPEMMSSLYS